MKKKRIIKHEVVNLLSIIQIHLVEGKLSLTERRHLVHLLKIASLIINHEPIYFGKHPELFLQSIALSHILMDLENSHPSTLYSKNSKDYVQKMYTKIRVDRYFFTEALQILISELTTLSEKKVIWKWDEKNSQLTLFHQHLLQEPEKCLQNFLKSNIPSFTEIGIPLSFFILKAHQVELTPKKHSLTLCFRKIIDLS